jgi:protein translocase SecG subunit
MAILFIFLSGIMFLNCIVLMLLILVQVPKKEAGAGMAFGGSAADALFGAGSGTALTTITKYSAGIFFGAALLMAIMASHITPAGSNAFQNALNKTGALPGQTAPPLMPATASNSDMLQIPSTPTPAAASNSAASPTAPPAAPPLEAPTAPSAAPPVAPPVAPPAAVVPAPNPATNK